VNSGPDQIERNYSSTYSGFNIHLNVSALLLEICRQINAPYTAILVPNTAHILQFTLNSGPDHIQLNYSSTYSGFNIQLNVSALQLEICRQFSERYTATLVTIQRTTSSLRNVNCGPGHVQCHYSSTYLGYNSQLNVSRSLLAICQEFNAPYTANMVPNTAQILHFTLSELWSRTYTL
jgi:hypothetical protein